MVNFSWLGQFWFPLQIHDAEVYQWRHESWAIRCQPVTHTSLDTYHPDPLHQCTWKTHMVVKFSGCQIVLKQWAIMGNNDGLPTAPMHMLRWMLDGHTSTICMDKFSLGYCRFTVVPRQKKHAFLPSFVCLMYKFHPSTQIDTRSPLVYGKDVCLLPSDICLF